MVIRTTTLGEALKVLKSNEEFVAKNHNANSAKEAYCYATIDGLENRPQKEQDMIESMACHSFGELEFILKCLNHYEKKEHFKTIDDLLRTIRYGCEKIINHVYDKP